MARNKENEYLSFYYTNQSIRKKIDKKLKKIASINANLGTDSTEEERQQAKQRIEDKSKEIEQLDPEFYLEIYPAIED